MTNAICAALVAAMAAAASAGDVAPKNAVKLTAKLTADSLVVGQEYVLEVVAEPNAEKGYAFTGKRTPEPILQLRVPGCIERAKTRNREFLRSPYELKLDGGRGQVRFTLASKPSPGDAIILSLTCYVETDEKGSARLVRRRGRIALKPGAWLTPVPIGRGDWQETSTFALGDQASSFKLPDKDGKILDLDDYLGKKNVLLVMYRAFW